MQLYNPTILNNEVNYEKGKILGSLNFVERFLVLVDKCPMDWKLGQ
jgi:glutaredoxin-related protein